MCWLTAPALYGWIQAQKKQMRASALSPTMTSEAFRKHFRSIAQLARGAPRRTLQPIASLYAAAIRSPSPKQPGSSFATGQTLSRCAASTCWTTCASRFLSVPASAVSSQRNTQEHCLKAQCFGGKRGAASSERTRAGNKQCCAHTHRRSYPRTIPELPQRTARDRPGSEIDPGS